MAYPAKITSFAQSVYLTVKNRYLDTIEDTDGQIYIAQVIDWLNGLLDEIETTTDAMGNPVYWNFLRTPDFEFGSAALDESTVDVDDDVLNVITSVTRPIKIVKDGVTVSKWIVVNPNQLGAEPQKDTVAKVGGTLYFSRVFNSNEDGGTIQGDVIESAPRATETNFEVLDIVKPKQLLVLGVAKNSVLPDIVQGGLTPSFVQKYNDLLQSSILFNSVTADSDYIDRDDYSYIGPV